LTLDQSMEQLHTLREKTQHWIKRHSTLTFRNFYKITNEGEPGFEIKNKTKKTPNNKKENKKTSDLKTNDTGSESVASSVSTTSKDPLNTNSSSLVGQKDGSQGSSMSTGVNSKTEVEDLTEDLPNLPTIVQHSNKILSSHEQRFKIISDANRLKNELSLSSDLLTLSGNFKCLASQLILEIDSNLVELIPLASDDIYNGKVSMSVEKLFIITKYNVNLELSRIVCLKDATWLNDEVVNFSFRLLQDSLPTDGKRIYFGNSIFMYRCTNPEIFSHDKMKNLLNINFNDYDQVLLPVNVPNIHWFFFCLNIFPSIASNTTASIEVIVKDSSSEPNHQTHSKWFKFLKKYLEAEGYFVQKKVEFKQSSVQLNNDDCGLFVIRFAEAEAYSHLRLNPATRIDVIQSILSGKWLYTSRKIQN
jgi:Ulp1 protease family, C-terminal catalytic domain